MAISLESLDADVLELIFHEICYEPAIVDAEWIPALIPLSAVSWQLRKKVLPVMFRTFIWQPHKRNGRILPDHLLGYVQKLRIITSSRFYPSFDKQSEILSSFCKLKSASHLVVQGHWSTSSRFVPLIAAMPALEFAEWSLTSFRWPKIGLSQISGLRHLVYKGAGSLVTSISPESPALETGNLTELIIASSSTLEHLDVQGRFMDMRTLSQYLFPNLTDLILRGVIYSTPEMVPLGGIMTQMPQLHLLELRLLSRPILEFTVYPKDRPLPTRIPSQLRSLLMYDISCRDGILKSLPRTVRSLSLLLGDYQYLFDTRCLLHWPDDVISVLEGRDFLELEEFRLILPVAPPPSWLHRLGQALPRLETLELHCWPTDFPNQNGAILASYTPDLSSFPYLRELRLSVGSHGTFNTGIILVLEAKARSILEKACHRLHKIRFIQRPSFLRPGEVVVQRWRTFIIQRNEESVTLRTSVADFLEKSPVYM